LVESGWPHNLPKLGPLLIQFFEVAVVLTLLVVLGTFLSHVESMGMGPGIFAAMLWPGVLMAVIVAGLGVVAYNLLLPKINPTKISEAAPLNYRDAVLRLLKDDERQVVEALTKNGGTAYQRDIQYATGFSKVKTHRVIVRLAERRLVEVTRAGKTNRIRIPSWLLSESEISRD
jgi:hypothetical protein